MREARYGAPHAALLVQQVFDHAAQVAVVRDDHVFMLKVGRFADAPPNALVARVEQAHEAAVPQGLAPDHGSELLPKGWPPARVTARHRWLILTASVETTSGVAPEKAYSPSRAARRRVDRSGFQR